MYWISETLKRHEDKRTINNDQYEYDYIKEYYFDSYSKCFQGFYKKYLEEKELNA